MEPINKKTAPIRLYLVDLEKMEKWITEDESSLLLIVHEMVEVRSRLGEDAWRDLAGSGDPIPEKKEEKKYTRMPEDELRALLAKTPSITQEEAYKMRPFSPYYYPYRRKEDGTLVKRT